MESTKKGWMKYLCIIILLFCSTFVCAQNKQSKKSIQGGVFDGKSKEAIISATVQLLNQSDSTKVQAVMTDKKGKFSLSVTPGEYILDVSFLGYKKFLQNINTTDKKENFLLENIYLSEDAIMLSAAVVEAKVPDVLVKGDTIQYNAGVYKMEDHELLQDLIKKIPGIEIDNEGVIKANGKPITKILVDGKEFFGNDIAYALNNLPATMVKSLQLFKEQSEEAKATGVKDEDPPQVLNLQVKEEFKKSMFGDVKAGYGSHERYASSMNVNRMHGDNQYSIIGSLNNISDGDIRYMGHGGNGINTNKDIGANFNISSSEKLKINGSADYSNSKSVNKDRGESYVSMLDRYSKNSSNSVNRSQSMSPKFSMNWKADSLTTIILRTDLGITKNESDYFSSDSSMVTGEKPTVGFSNSWSESNSFHINNNLSVIRRLNKNGRNIRLSLSNRYMDTRDNGNNYSETTYPDINEQSIIDNISKTEATSNSYGVSLGYVEPFGKDKRLQLSYSFNNSPSDRNKDARKKDDAGNYTVIDSLYSRKTKSDSRSHNINARFQSSSEKFEYSVGFNVDPSFTLSKVTLGDSIIEDLKQNVVNFSPSLLFIYKPKESAQLNFYYSGLTRQPGIRELSADTMIYNSMSKFVGNPNLKPSYENRINLDFRKSNTETGRYFNISATFNFKLNEIANYMLIDTKGNRIQTYKNVNGNMNAYTYASYSTPLRNKKFQLSLNGNVFYYKNIGFTNEQKSIIQNVSFSPSGSLRFNSDKVESNLNLYISHNFSHNNLADIKTSNTTRYAVSNDLKIKLPLDFTFRNSINYTRLSGYGEGSKNNEFLWNVSLEKLFLKMKMGTLRFQFIDILDDRSKELRMINGNDYSYSWNDGITSYVMFSFSYRFRISKSKSSNGDEMDNEYGYGGFY